MRASTREKELVTTKLTKIHKEKRTNESEKEGRKEDRDKERKKGQYRGNKADRLSRERSRLSDLLTIIL